ncbi:MAG: vitamin B12 dependent-methionine synthase activation domain-containing protein [Candidatus Woesearchaeota archaeon]
MILNELNIKIKRSRLERRIMGPAGKIEDWISEEIDQCLQECTPRAKGAYSFFECKVDSEKIELGGEIFHSKFLAKRFHYAKDLGLFIVTIGPKIEEKSKCKDPLQSFIYDAIGSEYAESSANALQKFIENEEGHKMKRYSPGYNDWDISDQEKLFKLVDGKAIGVRLTESNIMMPEKSVSGIIG